MSDTIYISGVHLTRYAGPGEPGDRNRRRLQLNLADGAYQTFSADEARRLADAIHAAFKEDREKFLDQDESDG